MIYVTMFLEMLKTDRLKMLYTNVRREYIIMVIHGGNVLWLPRRHFNSFKEKNYQENVTRVEKNGKHFPISRVTPFLEFFSYRGSI